MTFKYDTAGTSMMSLFGITAALTTRQREHIYVLVSLVILTSYSNDYGNDRRSGDRVVSIGEKPFLDLKSHSRREALNPPY